MKVSPISHLKFRNYLYSIFLNFLNFFIVITFIFKKNAIFSQVSSTPTVYSKYHTNIIIYMNSMRTGTFTLNNIIK